MKFVALKMAKGRKDTIQDFQRIMKDLDEKKYKPVYLLEGEEPFFIQAIAERLENEVLTEGEKGFNCTMFYGKETNVLDVVNACKRFPMMAEKQLVFMREAQQITTSIKQMEPLLPYLENPQPSTILVIQHPGRKVNRTTKLGRAFKKHEVLTADKLYDNQVAPWLRVYLQSKGLTAEDQAIMMLTSTSGANLTRLVNEVGQIMVNLEGRDRITTDDVAGFLGLHKEYNIFELQNAIGRRDFTASIRIVNYFGTDPKANPFPVVVINLFNFFKKVYHLHFLRNANPFQLSSEMGVSPRMVEGYQTAAARYDKRKLDQIFDVIGEFDRRFKGIDATKTSEFELLREMVTRIVR